MVRYAHLIKEIKLKAKEIEWKETFMGYSGNIGKYEIFSIYDNSKDPNEPGMFILTFELPFNKPDYITKSTLQECQEVAAEMLEKFVNDILIKEEQPCEN